MYIFIIQMFKFIASLSTEIYSTVHYMINGTEFIKEENSIQYYIIPIFNSDNKILRPRITSQLSINVHVNDTTCFLTIYLQYICNGIIDGGSKSVGQGCTSETEQLVSKWDINCYSGWLRFQFIAGRTVKQSIAYHTNSEYFY